MVQLLLLISNLGKKILFQTLGFQHLIPIAYPSYHAKVQGKKIKQSSSKIWQNFFQIFHEFYSLLPSLQKKNK